jgi:hypothetical protein
MARLLLALVLVCTFAASASAKNLCVQINTGTEAGAIIVLNKVQLGKGKTGPVQGYFAKFDQTLLAFTEFYAISGETIVGTRGGLVAGVTLHRAYITGSGNLVASSLSRTINFNCGTGANDDDIDVLDSCGGFLDSASISGHVVDCKHAAPAIP